MGQQKQNKVSFITDIEFGIYVNEILIFGRQVVHVFLLYKNTLFLPQSGCCLEAIFFKISKTIDQTKRFLGKALSIYGLRRF